MGWAKEEWRSDPERRRAAAELYARWAEAVTVAEGHLRAAESAFQGLDLPPRDSAAVLANRVLRRIQDALRDVDSAPRGTPSETYVGNMAAFGVGWHESGRADRCRDEAWANEPVRIANDEFGHKVKWDPGRQERWTCTECSRAVLRVGCNIYGSAVEDRCDGVPYWRRKED